MAKEKSQKRKLSIDIDSETEKTINNIRSCYNNSEQKLFISQIVNIILDSILNLDIEIRRQLFELLKEIEKQYSLLEALTTANNFQKTKFQEVKKRVDNLMNVLTLFGLDEFEIPIKTVKIDMAKELSVELFDDWKIVNFEEAKNSNYAYLVDCLNSEKYSIPKYVYFSDNIVDDETIVKKVCDAFPEFELVVNKQVELQYMPGRPKTIQYAINFNEYIEAPIIRIYDFIQMNQTGKEGKK